MHSTRYNHSGYEIVILHNADWIGEARIDVNTETGDAPLALIAPGAAILGLALTIAASQIQEATEAAIEKLIADATFGK